MVKKIIYLFWLLNLLSPVLWGKTYKFEYQKTVEVGQNAELDIFNDSGDISITGIDGDDIAISAIKFIRADNQEDAERLGEYLVIKAHQSENRLSLRTRHNKPPEKKRSLINQLFNRDEGLAGSVNFDIKVPYACLIDLENISGNVKIDGINADMDVTIASGDLDLRNISGDIEIESTSGKLTIIEVRGDIFISSAASEVTLKEITGTLDIASSSGDKIGEALNGSVTIMQSSGKIDLSKLRGNVRIKTSSGDINIEQLDGAINVLAHSGDIRILTELNSPDDYYIETKSGDIHFMIPSDASGQVKLESNTGKITTDLSLDVDKFSKNKVSGSFGTGGAHITLITSSGDIMLNRQ